MLGDATPTNKKARYFETTMKSDFTNIFYIKKKGKTKKLYTTTKNDIIELKTRRGRAWDDKRWGYHMIKNASMH